MFITFHNPKMPLIWDVWDVFEYWFRIFVQPLPTSHCVYPTCTLQLLRVEWLLCKRSWDAQFFLTFNDRACVELVLGRLFIRSSWSVHVGYTQWLVGRGRTEILNSCSKTSQTQQKYLVTKKRLQLMVLEITTYNSLQRTGFQNPWCIISIFW